MPDAPILKYEKVPVNVILVLKKVFDFVHKLCKYVCIFMVGGKKICYIYFLLTTCVFINDYYNRIATWAVFSSSTYYID